MHEPLGYSLRDLLRCHRERAAADPAYMRWAGNAVKDENGRAGYGDAPWHADDRGFLPSELYMYQALLPGRPSASPIDGVEQTTDEAEAHLFFVPLFAALSWFLAESAKSTKGAAFGMCTLKPSGGNVTVATSHAHRMLSLVRQVASTRAFQRAPERHFVMGGSDVMQTTFSLGLSRAPERDEMIRFTRRILLVACERSWGYEKYFRAVVLMPYVPVGALTAQMRGASEARVSGAGHRKKHLLFFQGSSQGHTWCTPTPCTLH